MTNIIPLTYNSYSYDMHISDDQTAVPIEKETELYVAWIKHE